MKEITILSGKGGAGKTTFAAALASVATNTVFCDNDVDAADLHLIFNPEIKESHQFNSGSKAVIHPEKCTNCGLCAEKCRFGAIHSHYSEKPEVNPFDCEGCRLCERICPEFAISMIQTNNNFWYVSSTRFGTLVHAKMGPGEENSGKLVTRIRQKACEIAAAINADYILNDGPPGIGCPVIASVTSTGLVLLVIEPSLSGLHDAKRLAELVESFNIPVFAVINKFDINPEITAKTEQFLQHKSIQLIGKIPFDTRMVDSMVEGKSLVEFAPDSELAKEFTAIWECIHKF